MYSLEWAYAHGIPQASASFKQVPEDFQVDEIFEGEFSGEGEHILLKIEKRGLTTEEVVKSLARLINKPVKLISYAGIKDRHALTTQWLSVHAPGEEIYGVDTLSAMGWRVITSTRHHKKLRPGFLSGNKFRIILRDISKIDDLIQAIEVVKKQGVPNYFGEQRFGREAGNLTRAEELLVQGIKVKDRFLKGMYFSAARSWIFNLILSQRVQEGTWNRPLAGDVMQLSGSHSVFVVDESNSELLQRISEKDISPASPLPGKKKYLVQGEALELIDSIYGQWGKWVAGLEKQGLEEAWRANILHVTQFDYEVQESTMTLVFTLPPGSYATAVLRELVTYTRVPS